MLYVALILAVTVVVLVTSGVQMLSRIQRAHGRREDLLIAQVLHLSGRPWTPPPADEWKPAADGEPLVHEYTAQPEQQPYV